MIRAGAKVAIVGGGIAGLSHAIGLAQLGVRCDVFDRAESLDLRGAGIQISENGAKALSYLGALQRVIAHGMATHKVALFDYRNARRPFAELDFERHRPDYRQLRLARGDLITILFERARDLGVQVNFGAQEQAQNLVHGLDYDLVIAADGVNSASRSASFPNVKMGFSGQVAWRALIPQKLFPPNEVRVYMAPNRHLVLYQIGRDVLNMVAVEERKEWHETGWSIPGDMAQFKKVFGDFDKTLHAVFDQIEDLHSWGLAQPSGAYEWLDDIVTLVGDAAHPSLPFMAQGANMALEGAVLLARSIDSYGVERGSEIYEKTFKTRTRDLISAARENGELFHQSSLLTRKATQSGLAISAKTSPNSIFKRWDWIYGFDATHVRLVR